MVDKGDRDSGFGKGKASSHKPQATRQENPPSSPFFQRGKEGDLNIGTRDRPLRGSGKEEIRDSGFGKRKKTEDLGVEMKEKVQPVTQSGSPQFCE